MALRWDWTDKMGEVTDENGYTYNLYKGNAFMIAIAQWEENGDKLYSLQWFLVDKDHLYNCLGLRKGYDEVDFKWKEFKLNYRYKETTQFIQALQKARKPIKITLYWEG